MCVCECRSSLSVEDHENTIFVFSLKSVLGTDRVCLICSGFFLPTWHFNGFCCLHFGYEELFDLESISTLWNQGVVQEPGPHSVLKHDPVSRRLIRCQKGARSSVDCSEYMWRTSHLFSGVSVGTFWDQGVVHNLAPFLYSGHDPVSCRYVTVWLGGSQAFCTMYVLFSCLDKEKKIC